MAFTKTPTIDTYSSQTIQLVNDLHLLPSGGSTALDSSTLSGMMNVLPFKDSAGKLYGETRPTLNVNGVTNGNSTVCRGYHLWEKGVNDAFEVLVTYDGTSSKIWGRRVNTGSFAVLLNMTVSDYTVCRFAEFIDATNNKKLCLSDGIDLYVITVTAGAVFTVTRCTDVDMPTPHVPFPVFLDGYLFLAKADTGDLYNSNLNDPLAWTAGSYISAEMYPDNIVALVRVNNYILAIGQCSSEYFYDAGNPTASPLARQESASLPFGTQAPNSIAFTRDTLMMLANDSSGEWSYKVVQGFKYEDFPAKAVLQTFASNITTPAYFRSGFFRVNEELFYFLAVDGRAPDQNWTGLTFAASVSNKMWVRTSSDINNSSTPTGSVGFPLLFTSLSTYSGGVTYCAGQFGLSLGAFTGKLETTKSTDKINGVTTYPVYQKLRTVPERFGTFNRKFMSRCAIDYQVDPASDNILGVTTGLILRWSDDFTTSWQTGYPIGKLTNEFPFVLRLGSFRERIFELTSLSGRIRWFGLEVDINKGTV